MWTLANLLATPKEMKTKIDDENPQTTEQQDQFEEQDAQSLGTVEIVSCCLVVTCWERADLLALVCEV